MRVIASVACASQHPATEARACSDADLIIRAVNSHAALVEALGQALHPDAGGTGCVHGEPAWDCLRCEIAWRERTRAALKLARGEV